MSTVETRTEHFHLTVQPADPSQLQTYDERARWARAKRNASLAKVEPTLQGIPDALPQSSLGLPSIVLTPREIEITETYTVTRLLSAMWERRLSVEEVTRAFLRRAALAHAAVRALDSTLSSS